MKYTKEKAKKYNCQKQKGITLIALIITVIVMMILVGVSVSVAIQGGLFEKATTAATEIEKQAIYEDIISLMEINNNGEINVEDTFDAVQKNMQKQYQRLSLN